MVNIVRQVIGSFEDIGKDVVKEVAKVPGDIAQKAMEGLGATSSPTAKTPSPQLPSEILRMGSGKPNGSKGGSKTALDSFAEAGSRGRQHVARAALEYLASEGVKVSKEPSIWERIQREQSEKKRQEDAQKLATSLSELPKMSSKRKRGDLYGAHAKATASERKTVRQD